MDFKEKEILNSIANSNFDYCPFVWRFYSVKAQKKTEKIQERGLQILYDDYPHWKSKSALEVSKTLNNLNPSHMKEKLVSR